MDKLYWTLPCRFGIIGNPTNSMPAPDISLSDPNDPLKNSDWIQFYDVYASSPVQVKYHDSSCPLDSFWLTTPLTLQHFSSWMNLLETLETADVNLLSKAIMESNKNKLKSTTSAWNDIIETVRVQRKYSTVPSSFLAGMNAAYGIHTLGVDYSSICIQQLNKEACFF